MKENFWKFKNNKWIRIFKGEEKACIHYCRKKKQWFCVIIIGKSVLLKKYMPTLFECSLWAEDNFVHKAEVLPTFFY